MNIQASITVIQTYGINTEPELMYRVTAARNTTDPKIGERLTEEAINALISVGFTVNVKDN